MLPKSTIYHVDTGRKLNVHKTFIRRLRLLLNVLCTFNLRPVSTGYGYVSVSTRECTKEVNAASYRQIRKK